jgi:hypothetical protein
VVTHHSEAYGVSVGLVPAQQFPCLAFVGIGAQALNVHFLAQELCLEIVVMR